MSRISIPDKCFEQVEGIWKEFEIRRVLPTDNSLVLKHFCENFIRDEPTSKLLGWSEDFENDICQVLSAILPQGMSFLAKHQLSGKIAAVRIIFHQVDGIDVTEGLRSRQAQILLRSAEETEIKENFRKKYGIDSWAEFFAVSTEPEFRNQGLAGELYERSMTFLKCSGFKHVLVIATSPYTRQALKKRGFIEFARMDYDHSKDSDGYPAFRKEELTEEHFALVMIKEL